MRKNESNTKKKAQRQNWCDYCGQETYEWWEKDMPEFYLKNNGMNTPDLEPPKIVECWDCQLMRTDEA